METVDVRLAENGRILLPAFVREGMGVQGGAKLILTLDSDEVRLSPMHHGISRARELYRQHATAARSTKDFLADRKAEAVREAGDPAAGSQDEAE